MGVASVHPDDPQAPDGRSVIEMRKKALIYGVIGLFVGLFVGNLISFLSSDHVFPWVAPEFAQQIGNGTVAFLLQCLV